MAKKKTKFDVKKNLRQNTTKEEWALDLWTLPAAMLWTVPATLMGLSGWSGYVTSLGLTWLMGAVLNKPSICRAAFAIGSTHLVYTLLSGTIQKVFNRPMWRMGTNFGTAGLKGVSDYSNQVLQPGSRVITLPNAGRVTARPAPELERNADSLMDHGISDYFGMDKTDKTLSLGDGMVPETQFEAAEVGF